MDLLKLAALDAEDLAVVSAHLQDAVIRVGDMAYLEAEKRFAFVANRFNWLEAEPEGGEPRRGEFERRQVGVQFARVLKVQTTRLRREPSDAVVDLLAIRFDETQAPGGAVTLVLAGGGAIRLEVECIEAVMSDLGPAWATKACPCHDEEEAGRQAAGGRA